MGDFFFLLQIIWFHFSVPQLWIRRSQRTFAILTTQHAAGRESPPNSSSLTGSERICPRVRHLLSRKLPPVDIGEAGKSVPPQPTSTVLHHVIKLRLAQCSDLNIDFVLVSLVRVRIQRPEDVLEVCPTILTEDSMQAQHLAATLALYNLVKGQVICPEDAAVPSTDV